MEAFERGDYTIAEPLLLKIIQESKTSQEIHETKASALYHLGELYRLQGKHEKSELFFWQALPIWAKTVGPTHPHMANGLTSLGYVYEAKKEYKKAEALLKQALKIREVAFGIDHPNIVPTLEQYAGLLHLMNRQEEAMALLARKQTILHPPMSLEPDLTPK